MQALALEVDAADLACWVMYWREEAAPTRGHTSAEAAHKALRALIG